MGRGARKGRRGRDCTTPTYFRRTLSIVIVMHEAREYGILSA